MEATTHALRHNNGVSGCDGGVTGRGASRGKDGRGSSRRRAWARGTALFATVLPATVLAACSSTPASVRAATSAATYGRASAGEPPRPPTKGPQPNPNGHGSVHLNVINGLLDGSPIYNGDFADPAAIHVGLDVYIYASDTVTAHIPVLEASPTSDYIGTYLGDALPTLPSWTAPGLQWAPAVWARPDGTYVMYYATPDTAPSPSCVTAAHKARVTGGLCFLAWHTDSRQCISRAVATSPAGPFVDDSTGPFICPRAQGGAIDPSVFVDTDGTPYLLWKSDGNGYGLPTVIYSQPLTADGLATAGPPHRLIGATQPWEGKLVEGPSMIYGGGVYWLFYSANDWDTSHYAIGIARCASVVGPCTKPLETPWLSTTNDPSHDQGPGGQEFVDLGGFVWMVHHGWLPGQAGTPNGQRRLYVSLVTLDGPGHRPALAPGSLAAGLADVVDGASIPGHPTNPQEAYLDLIRHSISSYAHRSDQALLALGQQTCDTLASAGGGGSGEAGEKLVASVLRRGSDPLGAAIPVAYAVEELCPQYFEGVRAQVQKALYP
jgi:hypothetical protein